MLSLLGLWGCRHAPAGERWIAAERLVLNRDNALMYDGPVPYTGGAYLLDTRTRDTQAVMHYKAGAPDGHWQQFYPGGRVYEDRSYKAGQKTGLLRQWWANGKPQLQVRFQNGDYDGDYCEWNPAGQLVRMMHYRNGQEDGRQECWYDNGQVKANYIIRGGRRYGLLGTKNCVNVSDSVLLR